MSALPGKTEFRLEYSDRNGVIELNGPEADARRIQNILLGHGRAGDYDLGVDIQSYLHEISDSITLNEIRGKVSTQIAKYAPDIEILEMVIETLDSNSDPSGRANMSLVIGFSIGTDTGTPYDFAIIAQQGVTGKVVTSLTV
jgi:hypothetical protein